MRVFLTTAPSSGVQGCPVHPLCVLPEVAEHVEGVLILLTVIQPAGQLALLICGTEEMAGPHPSTGNAELTRE